MTLTWNPRRRRRRWGGVSRTTPTAKPELTPRQLQVIAERESVLRQGGGGVLLPGFDMDLEGNLIAGPSTELTSKIMAQDRAIMEAELKKPAPDVALIKELEDRLGQYQRDIQATTAYYEEKLAAARSRELIKRRSIQQRLEDAGAIDAEGNVDLVLAGAAGVTDAELALLGITPPPGAPSGATPIGLAREANVRRRQAQSQKAVVSKLEAAGAITEGKVDLDAAMAVGITTDELATIGIIVPEARPAAPAQPQPRVPKTTTNVLVRLYPEAFGDVGSAEDIDATAAMLLRQLATLIDADPVAFLQDLMDRGQTTETMQLLAILGATPQDIQEIMGAADAQDAMDALISKALPGYDAETVQELIETDEEAFVDLITAGGKNDQKVELLTAMGRSQEEIDGLFPSARRFGGHAVDEDLEKAMADALKNSALSDEEVVQIAQQLQAKWKAGRVGFAGRPPLGPKTKIHPEGTPLPDITPDFFPETVLNAYNNWIAQPAAGLFTLIVQGLSRDQTFMNNYAKVIEESKTRPQDMKVNLLTALGEAYQRTEMPWILRLATDLISDPTNLFIPGAGIFKVGKAIKGARVVAKGVKVGSTIERAAAKTLDDLATMGTRPVTESALSAKRVQGIVPGKMLAPEVGRPTLGLELGVKAGGKKLPDPIDTLIEKYKASGRSAFRHPRLGTISLGGGRAIPEGEAVAKMRAVVEPAVPAKAALTGVKEPSAPIPAKAVTGPSEGAAAKVEPAVPAGQARAAGPKSMAERFMAKLDAGSMFEGGEVSPDIGYAWRSMGPKEYERIITQGAKAGIAQKGRYWSWFPAYSSQLQGTVRRPKYLVEVRAKSADEGLASDITPQHITGVWKSEGKGWVKQTLPVGAAPLTEAEEFSLAIREFKGRMRAEGKAVPESAAAKAVGPAVPAGQARAVAPEIPAVPGVQTGRRPPVTEGAFATPEAPAVPARAASEVKAIQEAGKVAPEKVTPLSPEGSATVRVMERIQFEPEKEAVSQKITQGLHKAQVQMVDDLYAIRRFTEKATEGGVKLSVEENPYQLARLTRGVIGKANLFIEKGTFGKKFWTTKGRKAVPKFTGEGLETILKEVKDSSKWQDFTTYLVARRTPQLESRGIKTGIDLADARAAIKELETKYGNFADLANRIYKYQDNLLSYAHEMGILSDELLEKLRLYGDYVPFQRVMNELQAKGFMGKKMADIAQPIKRIKGSEREIINPLENIIKNTYVLIGTAERNQVGVAIANLVDRFPNLAEVFERVKTPMAKVASVSAKDLKLPVAGLTDDELEAVVDIFRPSFFTRNDEVTVLINGKKAYFKVDKELRDALLHLDVESIGTIGKWLGAPARLLRAGATLSPDFMIRNPIRDQLTAFAYSKYGFIPGVDFIRGLASMVAKDADYLLFKASGAEHSMLVSLDRQYLHKTFKEVVEGKKFTDYVKNPLEFLRVVSEAGERATRLGEFKAGIRLGAAPLEAGFAARNVTLDFAQAGTTARALNQVSAFFNATIRGWARMGSSFKERPFATSAKVFGGITLPSMLLYMANRNDPRWKEIPQWQKDLFWIVMTDKTIYRIPKPFELGIIFGSMPERFLEWLDNKDPKLLERAFVNLADAGMPNPIPTAALPILEWITNYSFFRNEPVVPRSREKMPPELQYTKWSSEVSRKLGELLKMSPAKVDNTFNGYTAGLGRYVIDILDGILKKTGVSPDIPQPSATMADKPVVKAFVVRNPYGSSGQTVENFYETLEKYEAGEKYLQEMLKRGDETKFEEFKAEHPELLFFFEMSEDPNKEGSHYSSSARYLRRVASQISDLTKKQDAVYQAMDMTPEKKRELIDEIDRLKTEVAAKALFLLTGKGQNPLEDTIKQGVARLGELVEDVPDLSLEKPDYFDMGKLHSEFGNTLEAVTEDDLAKLKDADPLAVSFVKVKKQEKVIDALLGKRIYEYLPDLKEGTSFEEYYRAWRDGVIKDEVLSGLSRRQVELLREYHSKSKKEQAQFQKDNPDITLNPQDEWLKSHPKENAILAVWGEGKLLTQEAYDEAKRLIKELDIPDKALPKFTLPPDKSVKAYFEYQDAVKKYGGGSVQADLILKKNVEFREWRGLQDPETPLAALELKVQWDDVETEFEALKDKDDKVTDANGLTERDRALAELKKNNKGWWDDRRRIEAYAKDADKATADLWAERGAIADESSGFDIEEKLWYVDHPQVYKWALEKELVNSDSTTWNVPKMRIDVEWRKEEAEYEAIDAKAKNPETGVLLRDEYLAGNEDYRKARRQSEAWELVFGNEHMIPDVDTFVEEYMGYYEEPQYGASRDRWRAKYGDFDQVMVGLKRFAGLVEPTKIPAVQYDQIYKDWKPQFDAYDNVQGTESLRRAQRESMLVNDPEFRRVFYQRQAYEKLVPEQYVKDYADYYARVKYMKPANWEESTGQDLWYEDEWFMMEHRDFYMNVWKDQFGNKASDFSTVPSRIVFNKWLKYQQMTRSGRLNFRFNHRDLDAWGVVKYGWTPISRLDRPPQ